MSGGMVGHSPPVGLLYGSDLIPLTISRMDYVPEMFACRVAKE